MRRIVFYSWQSDLPNPTNRGLIQTALENATVAIASDDSVEVEPVVDRDTQGIAGSPDIASTIFAKITAADVFVADVSIISRPRGKRPCPNPNVMIELGYALKALGYERVVLVFNTAFGKIEDLPFDLRSRRLLAYNMPEATEDRATERRKLEAAFNDAIRAAIDSIPEPESQTTDFPAIAAIENVQANRVILLRRDLKRLFDKFKSLEPLKHSAGGTFEQLKSAVAATQEAVAEFSKIAEIIVAMNDREAAMEVYKWFGLIVEQYEDPEGASGQTSNADHDYFKFVGHELFVTFIAFLLREQRWDLLALLLEEQLPLRYSREFNGAGNVDWDRISDHMPSELDESKKERRLSLRADWLNDRHTTGGLAAIMPMDEFMGADAFLFLRGVLPPQELSEYFYPWRAWSTLYLERTPAFIHNAEQSRVAREQLKVLKVPNVAEYKKRLKERAPKLDRLYDRMIHRGWLRQEDIDKIASRPTPQMAKIVTAE